MAKKILEGESGTRKVEVHIDERLVVVDHNWKFDSTADRWQLRFAYDFSQVDDKEVMRLATLWVNKDMQNRMRRGERSPTQSMLEKQEGEKICVKQMYAPKERGPVDPKKAAESNFEKLSDDERMELMKKFFSQEQINALRDDMRK